MKGILIAFEGIDGSGKSSQASLLKSWLSKRRYTFITEWNSSEWIHDIIKEAKKKNLLTPLTFSLIHATDFADRYEKYILPMLKCGFVVIADRYIYTAYARDSVRGVDIEWVKKLYSFAVKPDITFYIRVPSEVALKRLKSSRRQIKPTEAGADVFPNLTPEEGFIKYQSSIIEVYDRIAEENNFVVVDGTKDPRQVQSEIRGKVMELWRREGL
ncbi:dTMP kinase [Sulfolobus acidocaldarius]|uniref:Probable thymidylate kinase n=4 Tax=Sulfolobus acidocaldarius TaxID=2285 RepID=Q4J7B6_SULAC|nr:dTMP kinase [Sulfolobus acidocaldarius]AAY81315.1 thymidylate kinase [Sulfolobus acidocaldarius DSM 639]AGE71955.1 dTMP kinase [Sulfolobus acidocaldarius N8]AGE74227.1 dTMP kinase [Sulfolobus acidocaldarius Ron12/I]ALU29883.1 thymidylate kinase [Sulfolobus acidocaldarius]ALU32623.1 thymidylate kinase [Sulfolobus acidocaldarius]